MHNAYIVTIGHLGGLSQYLNNPHLRYLDLACSARGAGLHWGCPKRLFSPELLAVRERIARVGLLVASLALKVTVLATYVGTYAVLIACA